jgi:hypothetical protein
MGKKIAAIAAITSPTTAVVLLNSSALLNAGRSYGCM